MSDVQSSAVPSWAEDKAQALYAAELGIADMHFSTISSAYRSAFARFIASTPAPSDQAGWQGQEAGAANTSTIDLDAEFWRSIKGSAEKSPWIPREHYFMNDWVSDVCRFLREPQGPEWQRIESAPKDGAPILAYGPLPGSNADDHGWHGVRETKWKCYPKGSPGYAAHERGEGPIGIGWDWYESVHNWSHTWNPTHWMPLPTAPTITAGEGGGS